MTRRSYRRAARVAGALALSAAAAAGCAPLDQLNAVATPTDLYLLTPKSTFDADLPKIREQIVVDVPTATAAVSTDRIAVQPSPLEVQYLPGARWVDRAPIIIQALLIESFENSGKVGAVGRSNVDLRADYVIVTDVREFQAQVPQDAPESALEVHVRLNVKIIDAERDRIVASESFERVTVAASDGMEDVAFAFDESLGAVMRKAVEWSVREMAARPISRRNRRAF